MQNDFYINLYKSRFFLLYVVLFNSDSGIWVYATIFYICYLLSIKIYTDEIVLPYFNFPYFFVFVLQ